MPEFYVRGSDGKIHVITAEDEDAARQFEASLQHRAPAGERASKPPPGPDLAITRGFSFRAPPPMSMAQRFAHNFSDAFRQDSHVRKLGTAVARATPLDVAYQAALDEQRAIAGGPRPRSYEQIRAEQKAAFDRREADRRLSDGMLHRADPDWRTGGSLLGNLGRTFAARAGRFAGSLVGDPLYHLIPLGRAKALLPLLHLNSIRPPSPPAPAQPGARPRSVSVQHNPNLPPNRRPGSQPRSPNGAHLTWVIEPNPPQNVRYGRGTQTGLIFRNGVQINGRDPHHWVVAKQYLLPQGEWDHDRGQHNKWLNTALDAELAADPRYAELLGLPVDGVAAAVARRGTRQTPKRWTWHHACEPGIMQLVPTWQNTPGSPFFKWMHRCGKGGQAIWGGGNPPRKKRR